MRYYRTYSIIAISFMVVLACFLAWVIFGQENYNTDLISIETRPLDVNSAKLAQNNDNRLLRTDNTPNDTGSYRMVFDSLEAGEATNLSNAVSVDVGNNDNLNSANNSITSFSAETGSSSASSAGGASQGSGGGGSASSGGTASNGADENPDQAEDTSGTDSKLPTADQNKPSLGGGGGSNDVNDALLLTGITCIFLKKSELVQGDYWESTPLSVKAAKQKLAYYAAIWQGQLISCFNRPLWFDLRKNEPNKQIYYYMSGSVTRPGEENVYYSYDYINKNHPEWFLLANNSNISADDYKKHDKRMRWDKDNPKSSYYNQFYLDIGNPEFQEWASEQVLQAASGEKQGLTQGYDGLAMDNVIIGTYRWTMVNTEYPNWKYKNIDDWHNAFFAYMKKIKVKLNKNGMKLIANHNLYHGSNIDENYWNELFASADGVMTERSLREGSLAYFTNSEWTTSMNWHKAALAKGLIDWWVAYPSESGDSTKNEFYYAFCSWLICNQPGKSLFYSTRNAYAYSASSDAVWYDEYNLPIGKPLATDYTQENCCIRDYSGAKIIVNMTAQTQTIHLGTEKVWWDWESKKQVTKLTIPSCTGRILLPSLYKVDR